MRLADALVELETIKGARTHRGKPAGSNIVAPNQEEGIGLSPSPTTMNEAQK